MLRLSPKFLIISGLILASLFVMPYAWARQRDKPMMDQESLRTEDQKTFFPEMLPAPFPKSQPEQEDKPMMDQESLRTEDQKTFFPEMLPVSSSKPKPKQAKKPPETPPEEITPPVLLEFSKNPSEFKKEVLIKIKVEKAEEVLLYLKRPQSLMEIYLGQAELKEGNLWQYPWDTIHTPNGEYYLIAKIRNIFGLYEAESYLVTITNETIEPPLEEVSQSLKQQAEILTELEKELQKTTQELKEGMQAKKALEEQIEPKGGKIKKQLQETQEKIEKLGLPDQEAKREFAKSLSQIAQELTLEKVEKKEEKLKDLGKKLSQKAQELALEKNQAEKALMSLLDDSDQDELSNEDEERYGTDPFNPDTDGDGYLDGIEVKNGYNPLVPSPGDKIVFEEPTQPNVGVEKPEIYQIKEVSLTPKGLVFTGKALPNSFITLYIYSVTPIIVTIKTDAQGNWSYTLDRELADGKHEVYVAITDNNGKIIEKSPAFVFVKEAQAISIISAELEKTYQPEEKTLDSRLKFYLAIAALVVLGGALIVLIIIAVLIKQSKDKS